MILDLCENSRMLEKKIIILIFRNREFHGDNNVSDIFILHNTNARTPTEKAYRFKELLMWEVDSEGYVNL